MQNGVQSKCVNFCYKYLVFRALFSASTYLDETPAFVLMMLGRMVFGVGSSSTGVITSRLQSFWFRDHELGLAFAISIVAGRLGSVANFLFTEQIADAIGMRTTLWLGTLLCGVGCAGALAAGYIHAIGLKRIAFAGIVQVTWGLRAYKKTDQGAK